MDDIASILFRGFIFYKFDLAQLSQGITNIDTMMNDAMIPIYIGYGLLIPMMYMVMNMMISYTTTLEDPTEYAMLCNRVGDLEADVKYLKHKLDIQINH